MAHAPASSLFFAFWENPDFPFVFVHGCMTAWQPYMVTVYVCFPVFVFVFVFVFSENPARALLTRSYLYLSI